MLFVGVENALWDATYTSSVGSGNYQNLIALRNLLFLLANKSSKDLKFNNKICLCKIPYLNKHRYFKLYSSLILFEMFTKKSVRHFIIIFMN